MTLGMMIGAAVLPKLQTKKDREIAFAGIIMGFSLIVMSVTPML